MTKDEEFSSNPSLNDAASMAAHLSPADTANLAASLAPQLSPRDGESAEPE